VGLTPTDDTNVGGRSRTLAAAGGPSRRPTTHVSAGDRERSECYGSKAGPPASGVRQEKPMAVGTGGARDPVILVRRPCHDRRFAPSDAARADHFFGSQFRRFR